MSKTTHKLEESLNRIDWNNYKMRRNLKPLMLLMGIVSYAILAGMVFVKFIDIHNIWNTLLFILGLASAGMFLYFLSELIDYFK